MDFIFFADRFDHFKNLLFKSKSCLGCGYVEKWPKAKGALATVLSIISTVNPWLADLVDNSDGVIHQIGFLLRCDQAGFFEGIFYELKVIPNKGLLI